METCAIWNEKRGVKKKAEHVMRASSQTAKTKGH